MIIYILVSVTIQDTACPPRQQRAQTRRREAGSTRLTKKWGAIFKSNRKLFVIAHSCSHAISPLSWNTRLPLGSEYSGSGYSDYELRITIWIVCLDSLSLTHGIETCLSFDLSLALSTWKPLLHCLMFVLWSWTALWPWLLDYVLNISEWTESIGIRSYLSVKLFVYCLSEKSIFSVDYFSVIKDQGIEV